MSIRLIVGLGNPGPDYQHTRHNAGAWWVEALAHHYHVELRHESKFQGLYGRLRKGDLDVHLLIPTTFMNCSGQSVQALANYYQISPAQILVAHDELDVAVGDVRFKFAGGHAGHNGLRDIIAHLNGAEFYRLRFGIGRPAVKGAVVDYVLKAPSVAEKQKITAAIDEAAAMLPEILHGRFEKVMQHLHTKN